MEEEEESRWQEDDRASLRPGAATVDTVALRAGARARLAAGVALIACFGQLIRWEEKSSWQIEVGAVVWSTSIRVCQYNRARRSARTAPASARVQRKERLQASDCGSVELLHLTSVEAVHR